MEKYKIARMQYLPEESDGEADALIVAITPLPNQLKMMRMVVSMTSVDEINAEQKAIVKTLVE